MSVSPDNFLPPSISLGLKIEGSCREQNLVNRVNAETVEISIKKSGSEKFSGDSDTESDKLFYKKWCNNPWTVTGLSVSKGDYVGK